MLLCLDLHGNSNCDKIPVNVALGKIYKEVSDKVFLPLGISFFLDCDSYALLTIFLSLYESAKAPVGGSREVSTVSIETPFELV